MCKPIRIVNCLPYGMRYLTPLAILFLFSACNTKGPKDGGPCDYATFEAPALVITQGLVGNNPEMRVTFHSGPLAHDTVNLENELPHLTDSVRQMLAYYQPGDTVWLRIDEITQGSCTPIQLYLRE